jgi:type 1 glutamine amidotransferase
VVSARTALVVVDGDDVYEELLTAADALRDILAAAGWAARIGTGTARFAGYDGPRAGAPGLVVLYRADQGMAPAAEDGLRRAVRDGLGLVGIHTTAYRAPAVLGAHYASHGPLPHESRFTVALDEHHPLTAGIAPFEIVHEHYELEVADDAEVLAHRAAVDRDEPLLTVRREGAGRVAYLQLGHDMRAWSEPGVRRLVARAADWATGSATTGGASTSTGEAAA